MGTPVKIEIDPDQDSSIYVFDIVFECRVRNMDLISDEELRDYGSFSTGMEIMNNDNMTQLVAANLSITQMATHVSKGYSLRFIHAQDVLKIYEFTQHHLQRWASNLHNVSLNGAKAPLDDLIILDTFCNVVYEQAKYYDQAKLTSLEQRFGTKLGFNAIKSMFNSSNNDLVEKLEKQATQHRKGFSELFREVQMKKSLQLGNGINMPKLNG